MLTDIQKRYVETTDEVMRQTVIRMICLADNLNRAIVPFPTSDVVPGDNYQLRQRRDELLAAIKELSNFVSMSDISKLRVKYGIDIFKGKFYDNR